MVVGSEVMDMVSEGGKLCWEEGRRWSIRLGVHIEV